MTPAQHELWKRIENFELDDPSSEFTFSDRLARDNGWTLAFSLRVIDEYKRFIFLMCIADHPLTPSDQVDQVWHLHLLYTQSYWVDLCHHTLKKQIHHGPTKGGKSERNKFETWYDKTLALYDQVFSCKPSADIWPQGAIHFTDIDFSRVNKRKNWIIPKPSFLKP
jgi:hypothetical protein